MGEHPTWYAQAMMLPFSSVMTRLLYRAMTCMHVWGHAPHVTAMPSTALHALHVCARMSATAPELHAQEASKSSLSRPTANCQRTSR